MKRLLATLALMSLLAGPLLAQDIGGSYVTVDPFESENGDVTLCFYAYNNSADFEWVQEVSITLPDCMTVLETPGATATPDAGTEFNVIPDFTGYGSNSATWGGTDEYGYGFLYGTSGGTFCVTVHIDCACDNIYQLAWTILGDGYGGVPHTATGTLDFSVLCSTSADETSWGNVKALY